MNDSQNTIFLISGPLGVGKSTTSKLLAQKIQSCVRIEGDIFLHMVRDDLHLDWEQRLRLAWDNLLALTRNFVRRGLNVVIDLVVEDELNWFCEGVSDLDAKVNYAVLTADRETIVKRLTQRGDIDSLDRSLFLLDKLGNAPENGRFIIDTTSKLPEETADLLLTNADFFRVC
ncbi:AAA family ATPase [Paenibacillus humicola]|uniref:AAA family ATPase n=1 Tax=Paenibacillus humicola TaxID=3110540 RepID=UPI00237B1C91|nr:AAA family ATPase [Paenibacillus humicola]